MARRLIQQAFAALRYPETLANATQSTTYLGHKLADQTTATEDWIRSELFERGLGIVDASSKEVEEVYQARTNAYRANRILADAVRPSFSCSAPALQAD